MLEALGAGQQTVLIRKGGLIEPGKGFELVSKTFVFYPTYEHQTAQFIREDCRRFFDDGFKLRAPEGRLCFSLCGNAETSWQSSRPDVVERLSAFHIYNEAFMTQRLKWQPDQPLTIVAVRAFVMPEPVEIAASPKYVGCKSWVDLEQAAPVGGCRPVLDDSVFAQRLSAMRALLE